MKRTLMKSIVSQQMAVRPDDQYEYRVCTECKKSKKVYDKSKPEPLWNHDEWIGDNDHLQDEKYKGLCFRCTHDELDFGWRRATSERYEAEGKEIPWWVWHETKENWLKSKKGREGEMK